MRSWSLLLLVSLSWHGQSATSHCERLGTGQTASQSQSPSRFFSIHLNNHAASNSRDPRSLAVGVKNQRMISLGCPFWSPGAAIGDNAAISPTIVSGRGANIIDRSVMPLGNLTCLNHDVFHSLFFLGLLIQIMICRIPDFTHRQISRARNRN